MKYYKIDGIPRFMIFDKVGNRAGERVNVELTVCKNGQAFLQNEKL